MQNSLDFFRCPSLQLSVEPQSYTARSDYCTTKLLSVVNENLDTPLLVLTPMCLDAYVCIHREGGGRRDGKTGPKGSGRGGRTAIDVSLVVAEGS